MTTAAIMADGGARNSETPAEEKSLTTGPRTNDYGEEGRKYWRSTI